MTGRQTTEGHTHTEVETDRHRGTDVPTTVSTAPGAQAGRSDTGEEGAGQKEIALNV